MKKLDYSKVEKTIVKWLKDYATNANKDGYVIGVSGGVDSAVVSTLCAKTGLKLLCIQMPIRQTSNEVNRASAHINWLMENFPNVSTINCELTSVFNSFMSNVEILEDKESQHMAEANTRSRLRMVTLYYYASLKNCLVAGTGNKVEDFGAGFFSKFGDGAVDISPIGDLMKSEVRELGRLMGISDEIVNAIPTDGLWDDGRGDEDQLKATYDELEDIMGWIEENRISFDDENDDILSYLTKRQQEVFSIYKKRHLINKHKMEMPPICKFSS